jgi:hypothetical protein
LDADEKPQQEVILKQFSYPGANVKNFFCPWFTDFCTKLECILV